MALAPVPDDVLQETVSLYLANGNNKQKVADALGLARSTVASRLATAARRGLIPPAVPAIPGFEISRLQTGPRGTTIEQRPERGEVFEIPEGHRIKGVSAFLDPDGRLRGQWVKTRENELDPQTIADFFKGAFQDYEAPSRPTISAPDSFDGDLLTLIPCNDWHINLQVWGKEASENWDLKIAEETIGTGIEDAIERSPAAGVAIVLGGGDLLHADNNENRTAKSGNVLQADQRHQKGLEVAIRLKVRTVDAALKKNARVIVRILPGNHDEYSSIAVAYFLLAYYRNEPRVTVDVDPSLFFWHVHGKVMLGGTHGHTVKLQDMASIMAHRRAEDWGKTKFRYIHGFHVHHKQKFVTEGEGVVMESHQAPIPMDAWHYGAGFNSGRSLQTITYHAEFGEISRVRRAILEAA
ncbi:hypothetical protein GOL85_13235 [Sinorhizobium medicae]|nr:hypothetical protein [Sinorhizobium medicae]